MTEKKKNSEVRELVRNLAIFCRTYDMESFSLEIVEYEKMLCFTFKKYGYFLYKKLQVGFFINNATDDEHCSDMFYYQNGKKPEKTTIKLDRVFCIDDVRFSLTDEENKILVDAFEKLYCDNIEKQRKKEKEKLINAKLEEMLRS